MDLNKEVGNVKVRALSIRTRTWTLTITIVIALLFSILVTITTKQKLDVVDFVFITILQILTQTLYFPDGELFGAKNPAFIANKLSYNEKASEINQQKRIKKLREYCKFEFEERKKRYISNVCGMLDITLEEFEILKQKTEEEINALRQYEFTYIDPKTNEEKSKIISFSKSKRKKIYNLIFKKLPVEPNYPETIMSAVENNGNNAIRDGSISYKAKAYIKKIFRAVVIGGIFAYIGYTLRDGIGLEQVVRIFMYLTGLFSTAVIAFSSGETCTKVFKSHFYVELINFIDGFNEWCLENQTQEDILKQEQHLQTHTLKESE